MLPEDGTHVSVPRSVALVPTVAVVVTVIVTVGVGVGEVIFVFIKNAEAAIATRRRLIVDKAVAFVVALTGIGRRAVHHEADWLLSNRPN